jgi:uncharacterized protein (TIGR02246 family)
MKRHTRKIGLILALTSLMATTAYANDTASEINKVNTQFETAVANGDAASLANNVYTHNGQVLPTTANIITGRENIQAFWQSVFDMGVKKAKLDTIELDDLGDTAVEVGKYTLSDSEDNTLDHGKYIVVWKKVDNQWQYHRDIWNSSVAPAVN